MTDSHENWTDWLSEHGQVFTNLEIAYKQSTMPAYREHNAVRVESVHGIKIHYTIKEPDKPKDQESVSKDSADNG